MKKDTRTQYHPALSAAVRMELQKDKDKLVFWDGYLLNTKPLEVDILIIKKPPSASVHNEIGAFFKEHNLIEYKSPDDTLGIDCFFKTYAYACLYKAASGHEDGIPCESVTITFIRQGKPRLLLEWLEKNKFCIEKKYAGIYYISREGCFDMQIIVVRELGREHRWLRSLRGGMGKSEARELLREVRSLTNKAEREFAESVLYVAMRINREVFDEMTDEVGTPDILLEIMAPKVEEMIREAREKAIEQGMKQGMKQGIEQGIEHGIEQGIEQGIEALIEDNLEEGRTEEAIIRKLIRRFSLDKDKAKEYYDKYAYDAV